MNIEYQRRPNSWPRGPLICVLMLGVTRIYEFLVPVFLHLSSTYIHPPSILSCVCASLSVLVVVCVSFCLSLSALRVNDYFLYNSFRSTDRSVYFFVHIRMRAPHLEISQVILQCLSVCHSESVSTLPLPPSSLPLSPSLLPVLTISFSLSLSLQCVRMCIVFPLVCVCVCVRVNN